MQLKKAVKSILLPVMESEGFSIIDSAPGYYEFGFNDDSLRVVVDKNPWDPTDMRVNLYYRDHDGLFSSLGLNQLIDYIETDLSYSNQEELENKLQVIADILKTHTIPLLKDLRDNHIFLQEGMENRISENPEKQAAQYAADNSLLVSHKLSNFLFVEDRIAAIRGDTITQWRSNFNVHFDEIIALICYYGEITRQKAPKKIKWNWKNDKDYTFFALQYDEGWGFPDGEIKDYWNYSPYIPAYTLVPIELRY
ncbi:MAG: hypothetical protein FWH57_12460 [Oscillospiraceae bacterium]|nr:hypothetical protein [Oscillospiraceae bacterium]